MDILRLSELRGGSNISALVNFVEGGHDSTVSARARAISYLSSTIQEFEMRQAGLYILSDRQQATAGPAACVERRPLAYVHVCVRRHAESEL